MNCHRDTQARTLFCVSSEAWSRVSISLERSISSRQLSLIAVCLLAHRSTRSECVAWRMSRWQKTQLQCDQLYECEQVGKGPNDPVTEALCCVVGKFGSRNPCFLVAAWLGRSAFSNVSVIWQRLNCAQLARQSQSHEFSSPSCAGRLSPKYSTTDLLDPSSPSPSLLLLLPPLSLLRHHQVPFTSRGSARSRNLSRHRCIAFSSLAPLVDPDPYRPHSRKKES